MSVIILLLGLFSDWKIGSFINMLGVYQFVSMLVYLNIFIPANLEYLLKALSASTLHKILPNFGQK